MCAEDDARAFEEERRVRIAKLQAYEAQIGLSEACRQMKPRVQKHGLSRCAQCSVHQSAYKSFRYAWLRGDQAVRCRCDPDHTCLRASFKHDHACHLCCQAAEADPQEPRGTPKIRQVCLRTVVKIDVLDPPAGIQRLPHLCLPHLSHGRLSLITRTGQRMCRHPRSS